MFSAKDSKDKSGNTHYDTLISARTEIAGDVHFSGGLHVDGVIRGNLIAEPGSGAVVRVSDKGRIEGEIRSPNVIINGPVLGDVHAYEYIELAKSAQVTGDVYYNLMEMVLGAAVNGQLHHQSKEAQAHAKPALEVVSDKVKS
ncbi:bactofilin family protein [Parathalassolituus penaei]|uniref:Polymer-forming cytoskeletal protein n=1 Tax=Parathalassolituus penaei TaxID=2997323 RepID=A0A9X3IRP0_9GAMM|nr:polymer-forming cytoskeletal protein [Parathalassolituus penaei]MCY0965076.1 polymer-forming cytoskeletal protein [Parathalassolituus penaei]